jgi:hypothetical protein
MAFYEARMNGRGVEFRLGTKRSPRNLFLAWSEIGAVQRRRAGNTDYYRVQAGGDRWAEFSNFTFFRAKKLARHISERAGRPIERIATRL